MVQLYIRNLAIFILSQMYSDIKTSIQQESIMQHKQTNGADKPPKLFGSAKKNNLYGISINHFLNTFPHQ